MTSAGYTIPYRVESYHFRKTICFCLTSVLVELASDAAGVLVLLELSAPGSEGSVSLEEGAGGAEGANRSTVVVVVVGASDERAAVESDL